PENWLSLYNERLVKDKEVENGKYVSGEKLVQTLFTKKNYIIHYRALQTYMKFRMKITKIHANGDEFGIMYYKLKNNAVFGKQMKNVCKHMRVELLRTEEDKKIRRLASSPLYVGFKAFEGEITAVYILKNLFLMKNETKGNPIGESVCLKPKMYSVLPAGHDPKTSDDPDFEDPKKNHGIQKAKGVKKCVVKRELQHDRFLECLRNKKLTQHDMYGLRSYDQIYLEK
ncbi:5038_t:CDS:2, partial [Gigaspora margarita]